ncbi:hypothetical protein EV697_103133 [Bisgaardia hudsonensis]|uniref:Uncharacterized protein n=1 Tax=Bisgaardia hudsonensis TaxID=109472 RepID=A0A4V2SJ36_9PAST|nr:hypothetical protein [Bisgaardia hudsonensis]QLB13423.1 hypothetical protein A6A11_07275 [Bisgaardia hudsonensis]TCP12828.1 hypothetical protein EV697_103133 [Bisgaardia hudsonensis]
MSINLLPWREALQKRKLLFFILRLVIILLVCIMITWFSSVFYNQKNTAIFQSKQKIEKLIILINQAKKDTDYYRKNTQQKMELSSIHHSIFNALFTMLNNLPFQQGELQELHLNSSSLNLKGYTNSQQEFDLLNDFLEKQKAIKHIRLAYFSVNNEQLSFELNLLLKDKL